MKIETKIARLPERMTAAEYRNAVSVDPKRKKARAKREPLLASRSRPAVAIIILELPVPPSVNTCWVNVAGAGRVRSPQYRAWHKSAAIEAALKRGRIDGRYTVLIELGKLPAGSDVDNRTKATIDMLAGLLTDDDQACIRATAEWAADVPARQMRVTLRSAA